jgi:DNA modification methylase
MLLTQANPRLEDARVFEPHQELTERVCYGMELDPKYVDVTVLRWQTLAGKKVTLEADGRTFDEIAAERSKEAA